MSGILIQPSPRDAIKLPNKNCVYCGEMLTEESATEEHVIGRRFVPKGTLFGQWNIILRACSDCNNAKSQLEDDISAITMQPDAHGQFPSEDERFRSEAQRKTPSISQFTGKPVGQSAEKMHLSGHFGPGATLGVQMSAPPQVSEERLYQLARFHVQGFFFFITFDKESERGGFLTGIFKPVMAARRTDWGNAKMRAFACSKLSWSVRFEGIAAEEYFKVSIRRHPAGAGVWAWALEWNQNFRIIGFFGSQSEVDREVAALPTLQMKEIGKQGNIVYRTRLEVALPPEEDRLFGVKTGPATTASTT